MIFFWSSSLHDIEVNMEPGITLIPVQVYKILCQISTLSIWKEATSNSTFQSDQLTILFYKGAHFETKQ